MIFKLLSNISEKAGYDALPSSPSPDRPPRRQHSAKYWISLGFCAGSFAILCLLAVTFAFKLALFSPRPPKSAAEIEAEDWNYCGRSSRLAKQKGCVMEPLFYGWMPPQCVYQELTKALPVFEDRKYYLDINMTQEVHPSQLWAGEHAKVYTRR